MNDKEREAWVMNDENLYIWFTSSKLSISKFINLHRKELTKQINEVIK